jgi:hypothetical protein
MEIKLGFNDEEIEHLCHTGSWSFVSHQKDRFSDLNDGKDISAIVEYEKNNIVDYYSPNGETYSKSQLRSTDGFLSAKVYATYHSKKYSNCYILSDEATGEWCVWIPEPLSTETESMEQVKTINDKEVSHEQQLNTYAWLKQMRKN